MKIQVRKIYQAEINGATYTVEFHKIDRAPGFTHRVSVNGMAKDWLKADHNPSEKTAEYYFNKHVMGGVMKTLYRINADVADFSGSYKTDHEGNEFIFLGGRQCLRLVKNTHFGDMYVEIQEGTKEECEKRLRTELVQTEQICEVDACQKWRAARDCLILWREWARAHGHLEHAAGIVSRTNDILTQ
jgi:hypothetical protein